MSKVRPQGQLNGFGDGWEEARDVDGGRSGIVSGACVSMCSVVAMDPDVLVAPV